MPMKGGCAVSEDFTFLPAVLAEIAEVAGLVPAIQIAKAKGGQRVTFPAKLKDGHWLIEAVGIDAARVICAHFATDVGGIDIDIPFGPTSTRARRKRQISELIGQGKSANQIARVVQVDRRTVFRHKKAAGDDSNGQGSLF